MFSARVKIIKPNCFFSVAKRIPSTRYYSDVKIVENKLDSQENTLQRLAELERKFEMVRSDLRYGDSFFANTKKGKLVASFVKFVELLLYIYVMIASLLFLLILPPLFSGATYSIEFPIHAPSVEFPIDTPSVEFPIDTPSVE